MHNMEFEWNFFENLDEIVYVADMETYTLVYMNEKIRKALGYESHEEYQGKLCYQELQRLDKPCEFCTNHLLSEGKFHCWTYQNPILNKRFLLKDTMMVRDGKQYRLEIAIDVDSEVIRTNSHYYAHSEMVIGKCLQRILSTTYEEDGLDNLLQYIGQTFLCDRVYIFELNQKNGIDNTYEWCASNIAPQKEVLQDEPFEAVAWWFEMFEKDNVLYIDDIESLRTKYPFTYGILKPQNIRNLAAGPIYDDDKKMIGFLGVDNPDKKMMHLITPLLHVIGYFISTLLKRRDMVNRLNQLSYHDSLTGALNRNALSDYYQKDMPYDTVGVIYCDISGLKKVNDTFGHAAGDELIIRCFNLMKRCLSNGKIYRIGGDEFIAVCPDITIRELHDKIEQLKEEIVREQCHIAVGYTWSDEHPILLEKLISQADKTMYQDKQAYYNHFRSTFKQDKALANEINCLNYQQGRSDFYHFIKENYCDTEAIFQSISMTDTCHYIYFGDLKTNKFFISDSMRDTFGFSSNIVNDLLKEWADRIATPEYKRLYQEDIAQMLREKRSKHDLRYQVKDVNGTVFWIRCCGILQWNEDRSAPIFFSGIVSSQDNLFLIDPITNYPREHMAVENLSALKKSTTIIAFSLNHFTEINETIGRYNANLLLQTIAERLVKNLGHDLDFYRLDGMRFLAIAQNGLHIDREKAIENIRGIIDREYHLAGISVRHSSSFGILTFSNLYDDPHMLIENAIAVLSSAKKQPNKDYVVYSIKNMKELKHLSNMSLVLSQNVLQEMEHFRIVIQPVVSTKTEIPIGGEVLIRWRYKSKDISPAMFVPMLEKGKNIQAVGKWVFEQAVRSCRRLIVHNPDFYLTFNVSYHQILDDDFVNFISQTLEKYSLSGKNLVAELTETHFDENPEKLRQFVDACNKLGIRVALDDFGNGYSSLGLLLKYPTSIVKLDRSLLLEMTESEDKKNFISSIVYACHKFGKKVCMEGVETEEQRTLIKESGCDLIQGYYYYRPMETHDIYQLICES